jgi:Uma2 family endonuclease
MSAPAKVTSSGRHPIAPTLEEWRAMAPAERERFLEEVLDSLSDPKEAMSEGRPHKRAKSRALDELTLHFSKMGRAIYLADEMAVLCPGQESFSPDILAVLDVPQPEDDERMAWVVADEGKGLDLVIEVLHHGNRDKDLNRNVAWYAALGIPEYFVYDRLRQRVVAYRLPSVGARVYQEIRPRLGRYTSQVLGLDLAIVGGHLRFFSSHAELIGSTELIARLSGMMDDVDARADEAETRAEQAEARAEQAEKRAGETEVFVLQRSVLHVLEARRIEVPDDLRATVAACRDVQVLERWLARAVTAVRAADVAQE